MKAIAALSLLLTLGAASPVDIAGKDVAGLEKRDTEIVYLANCVHGDAYYGNSYSSKILVGQVFRNGWTDLLTVQSIMPPVPLLRTELFLLVTTSKYLTDRLSMETSLSY